MSATARTALTWEVAVTACQRFSASMAPLSDRQTGRRAPLGFSRRMFARVRVRAAPDFDCEVSLALLPLHAYSHANSKWCIPKKSGCHTQGAIVRLGAICMPAPQKNGAHPLDVRGRFNIVRARLQPNTCKAVLPPNECEGATY